MNLICRLALIILFSCFFTQSFAHTLEDLIPLNTATHTAIRNGSWFDPTIWSTGTVPSDAAIVVIPTGISVDYEGQSSAHIFAIRVDGTFNCSQSTLGQTTTLIFDTFIGTLNSYVKFIANQATDGNIDIRITPFDIEQYKNGTSGYTQVWNTAARSHFSDTTTTYEVTYNVGPDKRFNTLAQAQAGNTTVSEASRSIKDDGAGVLGRTSWDTTQLTLGIVVMGQIEIMGQTKTNMLKLGGDALRGQRTISLAQPPVGWKVGDSLIVTRGGNLNASSNGEDLVAIQSIVGNVITTTANLNKNHEGRIVDNLHCYVGNLTRNITFRSTIADTVHQRGHFMVMHNDINVQIKDAAFVDMGRTDKSRLTDDFVWDKWLQPPTFKSKISALGQECAEMRANAPHLITNSRGRYSIHLHQLGTTAGANIAEVTGNVVWGNPGWGITHHDSYANVSDNVVFEVIGGGIVSETGSELGFWDNNLVVDVQKGHSTDPYTAAVFYDDYLYSGQGLAMKGRAVICRNNVIANAFNGVGIINMNPSTQNLDRVDALALATLRPNFQINQFPLSINGYSSEGDGVMPVEVALIMENTTVIGCNQGLRSIERDMGVNHESRSIFDGFIAWGVNQGLSITYQADYSFKDVFISGKNSNALGAFLWKHSHNHVFEDIKMVDLKYGITVSKLVESGNGQLKTRNNGFTPWYFVNLTTENVDTFYQIEKEDPSTTTSYTEHSDNPIHLSSAELVARPTTFTIQPDSSDLVVNYAAGDFRFEIDGIVTDDLGSYHFGIEQALAQGNLREGYPIRIYEFASANKLEAYLSQHGVYKDTANNNQLYFIIDEVIPNRRTYEYTTFPIRIRIDNAPSTGVFANPQIEHPSNFAPTLQLVSLGDLGTTVAQSSTTTTATYGGFAIDASASKSIDGNNNGRVNAQIFQRGLVPLGSFSETNVEMEPWYDMDLGAMHDIAFIDIWNTVELNGGAIETMSTHFTDFYVLVSDTAFGNLSLAAARQLADFEYHNNNAPARKFSLNHINARGRYVRIQAVGNTKMKLAEVEIVGQKYLGCAPVVHYTEIKPTDGTIEIAIEECEDTAGWTNYYDSLGQILLSIKKNGNHIGEVGDGTFEVSIGGANQWYDLTNAAYTANYFTPTNGFAWGAIGRFWNVEPTVQPRTPVQVRFYYKSDDVTTAQGGFGAATASNLLFYKIRNHTPAVVNPSSGHTIVSGSDIEFLSTIYQSFGDQHYVEFNANSFSGGGGGASASPPSIILPIGLLGLTGQKIAQTSLLTWSTTYEQDNAGFIVQRSNNGTDWTALSWVNSKGNSTSKTTYQLTDKEPLGGENYYRIIQQDIDGSTSISNVVVLVFEPKEAVLVYPNPTQTILTVEIPSYQSGVAKITIYNSVGQLVADYSLQTNRLNIPTSSWTAGTYFVRIEQGGIITKKAFIKMD
jgi:hypothetical protein